MTLLDSHAESRPRAPEPHRQSAGFLGPVLSLGRRQVRVGILLGLAGALIVHGAAAGKGLSTLVHLSRFASIIDQGVAERMRATYNVDVDPPQKAEVPETDPPPEEPKDDTPKPVVQQPDTPAPQSDNPYVDQPPPEAAQAGKVLTAEPDPSAPLDLTDKGFVTGSGDRYAGGTTTSGGTSDKAVYDPRAKTGGAPKGTGKTPGGGGPPAAKPTKNLSKAAGLLGGGSWNDCGFPPEADMDQVDYGVVTLTVRVGTDGRPQSVSVLADPGHGFGRLARSCAMRKRYTAGLDEYGKPTVRNTPPIRVRFTR